MAAKQQLLFQMFMAMMAIIIVAMAYEHGPDHDGPPSDRHHPGANDTDDGDRHRWHVSVGFHKQEPLNGPPGPGQVNPDASNASDASGERRSPWSMLAHMFFREAPIRGENPKLPEGFKLDQEERLYGLVPVLVKCNYTTQAGRSCDDCTHSLLCFSNNLGLKRDCGSRYCNEGRCSAQPSASCNATANE